MCDTSQKTAVLVRIVGINLMVFSKRNIFFLNIYILDHTCHSCYGNKVKYPLTESYIMRKEVKFKEYIYIVFTSFILL